LTHCRFPTELSRNGLHESVCDLVRVTGANRFKCVVCERGIVNFTITTYLTPHRWREWYLFSSENELAWKALRTALSKQRPRVPAGKRIYAVGDIHGRADLLSSLFTRIDNDLEARPHADATEIFLGDYVDRGPNSREVIDLLIERRRRRAAMFLKGNHEECVTRFLAEPDLLTTWKNIGGLDTVLSYGVTPERRDDTQWQQEVATALGRAMPESHYKFLHSLLLSFTCGDFFFAHAGVRPGVQLSQQTQQDLLWIREDFLWHEEDFGKVIVHGHTPTKDPEIRSNRINIDTGAYATGRLTCLVLEQDEMRFL
jgi:serine/threonine protein phosphatase 1